MTVLALKKRGTWVEGCEVRGSRGARYVPRWPRAWWAIYAYT